jgi:hypothetical protein
MATIVPTVVWLDDDVVQFKWEGFHTIDIDPGAPVVEEHDVGVAIPEKFMDFMDRVAQVVGTFGDDGAITIEGSNHGGVYATLTDPQGLPLDFTAAKIEQIMETPLLMRPRGTNGEIGVTDLDVIIIARRSRSAKAV